MPIDSNDKYIWLVRHGESIQNVNPNMVKLDNNEIPLTAKGLDQAREFANLSEPIADRIFISPHERAINTAAPFIVKHVNNDKFPIITIDKALTEFSYYDTTLRDALHSANGSSDTFNKIIEHYWEECDTAASHGYGTENYCQFLARVVTFLSSILNVNVKGNIVAFSHYYVITCIDNIFQGSVDIDDLENDNVFDLAGACHRIEQDPDILKELMINNAYDFRSPIQNCTALYIHLRPYGDGSPLYRVIEYGYRKQVTPNGIMGEDVLAE